MRRTNNKQPSKPLYASLIHARFPRLQCPFDDDPCFPHSPNAITNFQILLLNAQWRISSSFTQFRLFKIKSRVTFAKYGWHEEWRMNETSTILQYTWITYEWNRASIFIQRQLRRFFRVKRDVSKRCFYYFSFGERKICKKKRTKQYWTNYNRDS